MLHHTNWRQQLQEYKIFDIPNLTLRASFFFFHCLLCGGPSITKHLYSHNVIITLCFWLHFCSCFLPIFKAEQTILLNDKQKRRVQRWIHKARNNNGLQWIAFTYGRGKKTEREGERGKGIERDSASGNDTMCLTKWMRVWARVLQLDERLQRELQPTDPLPPLLRLLLFPTPRSNGNE